MLSRIENKKMFIIDCQKKGNLVRFYLGNDPDYSGDDWDDFSYENNCGLVYNEYVLGYKDIVFPFEYSVLEPADGAYTESHYSREQFKRGIVPCIIAVDNREFADTYYEVTEFSRALGYNKVQKFYFGDEMEPDVILKEEK